MTIAKWLPGAATLAALALATSFHPARAADLTIGVVSEVTTLDPHFFHLTPNTEIHKAIYSGLVTMDPKQNIIPDLAVSWAPTDDTHWQFKLRDNATFSDGTPVTADDVVFTYARARNVPNSPASFLQFLKHVTDATAVDAHTLRITTDGPDPILPNELMNVWIVSRKHGAGATTQDYNSGHAAIGSGPYKFVSWTPGDHLTLERNDAYFGPKPEWQHVTYKPITSDPARVAALLSGDVDMINAVPSNDIETLQKNKAVSVTLVAGDRIVYMMLDQDRDNSPSITDAAGNKLTKNPFKDVRVRRALNMAVDRHALVTQVTHGVPSGQFTPDFVAGHSPTLKPPAYDLAGARKLLAEAGYPQGFGFTLAGPNDRYPNDAQIVQAVAQMWSRAGLKVKVDTMPKSVYFTRAAKLDFSALLSGNSSDTAEPMSQLQYTLGTYNVARGIGAGNQGRYSNPDFDSIVDTATRTLDPTRRAALLAQAADPALGHDAAAVPLYFVTAAWATRKGLAYGGFPQEATVAALVHSTK